LQGLDKVALSAALDLDMTGGCLRCTAASSGRSGFRQGPQLVAYVGLNPKVRQSGNSAPVHGRISKAGRAQVRGVLVEAAWSASRAPGPLRAFFQRIKARRRYPVQPNQNGRGKVGFTKINSRPLDRQGAPGRLPRTR